MAVEQAFTWGGGGRKRTQDQIDMERKIAAALVAKGGDFSPVGHWSQGLARVAQGVMGAVDDRRADAAENENSAYNSEIIASLLGGAPASSPQASAALPTTTGVSQELAATSPATDFSVDPSIKAGIADTASALGIDPVDLATAISYETGGTFDPTKGGPTTQWGQHKGLIQFGEPQAQKYGVDWNNPVGSQLGPEGAVAKYLRDTGVKPGMGLLDIYSAINAGGVGRYDRSDANNGGAPGTVADKVNQQMGAHRAKALALFPAQTAAATPQAAIEAVAPASGYVDPMVSAQGGVPEAIAAVAPQSMQPDAPALPPPVAVSSPPAVAVAPQQQVAQALTAQPSQANPALNPAIIKALTDPRASPGTKAVAQIIMQQEQAKAKAMQDQQSWLARQEYEQQQQRSDPLYQLKVQQAQNEATGQGKAPAVVEIFDEATGQPYKATWNPKSGQYERIGGVKARSGMQLTTNPDGTVSLTEGSIGNMPKLTESEGRNSGFYGRGVESHQILNNLESQGTSIWNKTVGSVPFVGNFAKSEDAQKYEQARRNFINSVLRRESGAVISPEEFSNADQQYFPQPGDGPEVIEQKRRNRETTIQGLKISSGQGAAFATPPAAAPPEKKRLKYNPQTGELE